MTCQYCSFCRTSFQMLKLMILWRWSFITVLIISQTAYIFVSTFSVLTYIVALCKPFQMLKTIILLLWRRSFVTVLILSQRLERLEFCYFYPFHSYIYYKHLYKRRRVNNALFAWSHFKCWSWSYCENFFWSYIY